GFGVIGLVLSTIVLTVVCSLLQHGHHKHLHRHHRHHFHDMSYYSRMHMGRMPGEGAGEGDFRMHAEGDSAGPWHHHQRLQEFAKRTPEERATRISERMTKKLGLNDDQKKKIYAAALIRARSLQDLMEKKEADRTQRKSVLKPVKEAFDDSMKTILTPAQYTQWKSEAEERGHHRNKDQTE
ncbi:MAG TPA: hypothetical protein VNZ86_12660, partial [Bacteroidia bacterium]|nr:hypothetical protein [Bacteroidia bacterium]